MADLNWKNATLFMKKETTEGTGAWGTGLITDMPSAGDAILCRGLAPKLQRDWLVRAYQGSVGQRPGVIGKQSTPGFSFETELKGNGTTNTTEIDELLENAFGAISAGGASTTISGSASTTTSINVTSSTGFTVGNMVNIQLTTGGVYESAMITAAAGNVLTVTPALTTAPVTAGTTVDEMRTCQIVVPPSGVNSLTGDVFYNSDAGAGQFDRFVGLHCAALKISSPRAGSIPMLAWEFAAWNWTQATAGTRPTPTYDTTSPKPGLASKFKVGGTLTDIFDFELDMGIVVARKESQNSTLGIYGTPIVDVNPTGSFKIHPAHTSVAQFTGWTAETAISLIQQFGNTRFNTWAWYAPQALRREVSRGDDGGLGTNEIAFDCTVQDDALASTVDAALYLAVG